MSIPKKCRRSFLCSRDLPSLMSREREWCLLAHCSNPYTAPLPSPLPLPLSLVLSSSPSSCIFYHLPVPSLFTYYYYYPQSATPNSSLQGNSSCRCSYNQPPLRSAGLSSLVRPEFPLLQVWHRHPLSAHLTARATFEHSPSFTLPLPHPHITHAQLYLHLASCHFPYWTSTGPALSQLLTRHPT